MRKNLKIWGAAFLMGVGAARICVWINAGIVHLLVMHGGWEVAEAFKAAPWVLLALGFGLLLSVSGLLSTGEHYKRSAEKQCHSLTVDESPKENARRGA